MSRKPSPESFVPGDNLTGEGGGINSAGDMEAHPCLMRFLTNLARLCASKSANGPRKNSFRPDSPSTTTYPRGRKTQTAPSPHRTWSVPDASSQPQLNLYFSDSDPSELLLGIQGHAAINKEDLTPQAVRSFFLLYSYKRGERRRLHCSLKRMISPLAS